MAENVRGALVELLTDDLGTAIDTADSYLDDGWLTAHVALRTVEWVLDAAGYGPDTPSLVGPWRRLGKKETVDTLAGAHWRYELSSDIDDDLDWPLPVGSYVGMIEAVLGLDLTSLPATAHMRAPARFAAPNKPDMVRSIEARAEFHGRFDPNTWLIQPRVGRRREPAGDPTDELDRFIAHWSYRRDHPNPWVEVGRDEALAHIVAVQRTSLVSSGPPRWDPGADAARDRAVRFLACFTGGSRFFTNGHGYRGDNLVDGNYFTIDSEAMWDTGIVMISDRMAGIWWHSEGDPDTPLGMSP